MIEYVSLNNGLRFPTLSLGTYKLENMTDAVSHAIDEGYRAFDTAAFYKNEEQLAYAIAASGEPREELLITSKIWRDQLEYDQTLRSFEASEQKLGKVDIMLIHWPCGERFLPAWKALERIYEEKRIKAIGVSNFRVHHLETLANHANVKPVINQIEAHLGYFDDVVLKYCREKDIQACAWSPLKHNRSLTAEGMALLESLAVKYGKSSSQVALRYLWQKGFCLLPKASSPQHLAQNANIFDFALNAQDMHELKRLQRSKNRSGEDPDEIL